MAIVRFFLAHRLLAVLLTVGVLGGGVAAWRVLPIDAFPDVTNVQVMVLARAPGLSTAEVERRISRPIELAMTGLPRVTEVRSLSRNGLSQVRVLFAEETDIYFARQLVHERLAHARESLPPGVEAELGPISTGLGEIYQYTVESGYHCPDHPDAWQRQPGECPHDGGPLVAPQHDLMTLRTLQDWDIAPRLKDIPGVNEVNSFGGYVKLAEVRPRPERLLKYDVTLDEIVSLVSANNANAGGGFVVSGEEQYFVVSKGLATSLDDLRQIVVRANAGAPLLLEDVADVEFAPMARMGAVTRDGRGEVVAGMVIMLKGANSRDVVSQVKERIPDIQRSLPPDVRVVPFYDRTDLIQASVQTISNALLEGGFLVLLVLLLFLWDLRSALVVALSLPLTASLVFVQMKALGLSANLMTLGGLAIAVGMVVDGTIVVVENVAARLRSPGHVRESRRSVALAATREVARPIATSILIIVLVMLPLFTLEQVEGKMFKPLATTIVLAMASSLVVALTVVPSLVSLLGSRRVSDERGTPVVRLLQRLYEPTLRVALRFRGVLAVVLVALAVLTAWLVPRLGTEFLPPLDEGALAVNVVRLPSASLDASKRQAGVLERVIMERFPEVTTVVSKTGRPVIAEDPMGPEQTDLLIMLAPRDEWRPGLTRRQLVADLAALFGEMPGIRASFSQPIALRVNELISGVKSDVALRIFGDDPEQLRQVAEAVAPLLAAVPGAEDVKVEQTSGQVELQVLPYRDRLAVHSLNVADLNELVETAVGGRIVGQLYEGERWFGIQVRYPEDERNSAEALERIPLLTPTGGRLFLGDVARVVPVETQAQVSRDASRRRLLVECNVRGRDLGGFVAAAQAALEPIEAGLPDGMFFSWGGQFENQQRATQRLSVVVPVALLLILLAQLFALRNARSTLLVVLNLPFSVVGGIGVIWLAGMHVSVSVVVGLVALFGMAVQHGTVLVSFIDQLREEGMGMEEAVRTASLRRLRPLLMTKLTSVLGLVPMLISQGPGADIQRPLALVVLGGLAFTTLLNTHVVPALYPWFHAPVRWGKRSERAR